MEVSCLALVVLCSVKVEGSGAGVWRVDPETPTNWDPLGTISDRSDEVVSIELELVNFPSSVLVTLLVVVGTTARTDFSWVDLSGQLNLRLKVLEGSVAASGPCNHFPCMDGRLGVSLFVLESLLLAATDESICCSLFEKEEPTCDG